MPVTDRPVAIVSAAPGFRSCLQVQDQLAAEHEVPVGAELPVVVGAAHGHDEAARAAEPHVPAGVQDVAGVGGVERRGFLRRETGLQCAALDVDRARLRAGDRELAAFNRRVALVGVVARQDQRPGALLGQRGRVEAIVDLLLDVGRARIHPLLAPLERVLIGDLVVALGMAAQ